MLSVSYYDGFRVILCCFSIYLLQGHFIFFFICLVNLETLSFCGYLNFSTYTVHLCCFPLLLCLFVHILCFTLYSCITFLFSVTFILSPLRKFSNSDFFVTICVNVIHWMSGCDQVHYSCDSFCDHFVSLSTWQSYACCFPYILCFFLIMKD